MHQVNLNGFTMLLHGDNYLEDKIVTTGSWEPETTQVFRELINPGMVVLDIGANIGYFSLLSASLVGAEGQVHSFEPYPGYQERFKISLENNRFSQVRLIPFALSDKIEEQPLFKGLASARMHQWTHDDPVFNEVHDTVTVRCFPLDLYADRYLNRVDLIKIDVDGYEMHVLTGGQECIRKYTPTVIIELCEEALTTAGTSVRQLLDFFQGLNYIPYSEKGVQYKYEQLYSEATGIHGQSVNAVFRPMHQQSKHVSSTAQSSPVPPKPSGQCPKNNNLDSRILILDSIQDLIAYFGFKNSFTVFEDDLDRVNNPCDVNQRKRRDAEVLSVVAANAPTGKMLDIGTHLGRSAARMAVNSPQSLVYTVNIHPEDAQEAGELVTDILSEDQIGSFYRARNIQNIQQIYANTKNWQVPDEINELSLVYVDGCHDTEFVVSDTKLLFNRVQRGGYILWHDFTPLYRKNFSWIDAAMQGVDQLAAEGVITGFILNVRNSWIGIWKKI